jgi:GT2 family glycosyltransferase
MDALAKQDHPHLEFLLTDGGSTDGTLDLIHRRQKKDARFIIINNPKRFVSHGFNLALKNAAGAYIAFLGAHAKYPDHYLSKGYEVLKAGLADAAGGPLRQAGHSKTGAAIAWAMSSPFGVGNTAFRTSTQQQYVDSVAFAVYRREVFEKVGEMDEDLIRNQDDEFHYRMNAAGLKILMIPEMSAEYYVRGTFKALFKQYFEYGLFKPLVLKKVKSGIRIRHLVPALWVAYLLILPFCLIILPKEMALAPLFLYLILALILASGADKGISRTRVFLAFLSLHTAYGTGFLKGIFKLI